MSTTELYRDTSVRPVVSNDARAAVLVRVKRVAPNTKLGINNSHSHIFRPREVLRLWWRFRVRWLPAPADNQMARLFRLASEDAKRIASEATGSQSQ